MAYRDNTDGFQTVVRSVFQGIGLSFLLAFFIIAIGTNNWLIALMTCLMVAFVVIMMFGIIAQAGYKLGVIEAIDFSFVVAVAMVYIVPVGCSYATACALDRKAKTRKALEASGPAILIGMFMLCCHSVNYMNMQVYCNVSL